MDASSAAYSMLTTSYNKVRAICSRYGASVGEEEVAAGPAGFAFHRDVFPTPELATVTAYGVIGEADARAATGLGSVPEEPGPGAQALLVARSLLRTADLPAAGAGVADPAGAPFEDCLEPAAGGPGEVHESVRVSRNERLLLQNPELAAALQQGQPEPAAVY